MKNVLMIAMAALLPALLSATAFAGSDYVLYTGYTNYRPYNIFTHEYEDYAPCSIRVYKTKDPDVLRIFSRWAGNYDHNASVDLYRRVRKNSDTFATAPMNSRKVFYILRFTPHYVDLHDSKLRYTCRVELDK